MSDIIESLYSRLIGTPALTALLYGGEDGVVSNMTDSSGRYPIVVYQVVNDTPHMYADDTEIARRVTVQISIVTTDGDDQAIVDAVRPIMAGLGWMRQYTERYVDDNGYKDKALRFTITRYILAEEE